mmetsp:Transcript_53772/g.80233  ORF Transcript_53772/g.80233 Transcript_53772/m.80233 type:complete len:240 (-) Transcript_53772:280-999(-)
MKTIVISLLVADLLLGCSHAFSSIRSPTATALSLRTRHVAQMNKDANHDSNAAIEDEDDEQQIPTSTFSDIDMLEFANRREILKMIGFGSAAAISAAFLPTSPSQQAAHASGGATAGGAYLLSAKQRYNDRVVKGLTAFSALGAGDDLIAKSKEYFATEEVGGWKDASTAGYLLANAFRTSSATPPDRLPSVKAWKAFAKEVESMMKSIKKKESKGAAAAYANAMGALDAYVKEVELQL